MINLPFFHLNLLKKGETTVQRQQQTSSLCLSGAPEGTLNGGEHASELMTAAKQIYIRELRVPIFVQDFFSLTCPEIWSIFQTILGIFSPEIITILDNQCIFFVLKFSEQFYQGKKYAFLTKQSFHICKFYDIER